MWDKILNGGQSSVKLKLNDIFEWKFPITYSIDSIFYEAQSKKVYACVQ